MGYNGYLIKVGSYKIDQSKYIQAESYSVTKNVQDLDSYRDASGVLHRTVVENAPLKVEFTTPPMLTNTDMENFMAYLRGQFTNKDERKGTVTAYCPELGDYIVQDMYLADVKFEIYGTYDEEIHYKPIRFAFIGY